MGIKLAPCSVDSILGRCLLVVGVGLVVWAMFARQERLRVQERTRNHAVAMFDSFPVLADSVVESERISGNWKLRTAAVERLVVTRQSIEEVCEFYSSKIAGARWSTGIAPNRCVPSDDGLYRLSGWFTSENSHEIYTFQLLTQSTDRASWAGAWVRGAGGFDHFHHAIRSGGNLLMLSVWFFEDTSLRNSPCRSWEDSSCEDGAWEFKR